VDNSEPFDFREQLPSSSALSAVYAQRFRIVAARRHKLPATLSTAPVQTNKEQQQSIFHQSKGMIGKLTLPRVLLRIPLPFASVGRHEAHISTQRTQTQENARI
jgi:hypothetical protein